MTDSLREQLDRVLEQDRAQHQVTLWPVLPALCAWAASNAYVRRWLTR